LGARPVVATAYVPGGISVLARNVLQPATAAKG